MDAKDRSRIQPDIATSMGAEDYVAPAIEVLGTLAELTEQIKEGTVPDGNGFGTVISQ